jgi:hypothetical protein
VYPKGKGGGKGKDGTGLLQGLDWREDWTGARERQQEYGETPVVKEPRICADFLEETISASTGNFV